MATAKNRKTREASPRRLFECKNKHPRRQFTVKTSSIFEDNPLPLDVWFVVIWSIANCKNGISSYELSRATGVTQKSAWFVLHRIRLAMDTGGFDKFSGVVESDETYIGGLAKNMHEDKRAKHVTKANASDKAAVMGILECGDGVVPSRIRARITRTPTPRSCRPPSAPTSSPGTQLVTDSLPIVDCADYIHQFVNHSVEYVRGAVHTNGMENFRSLLKRTVKGTYVSVDPLHLNRYFGEQAFRFQCSEG